MSRTGARATAVGAAIGAGLGVGLAAFSAGAARAIERAVPPPSGRVRAGGAVLALEDRGRGRPLVLIHGLAGQSRNFADLVPLLAADHRVVAFDRPGSGRSARRRDRDASLDAQARIACALIEALALGPAVLVGHSFGGAVALRCALDRPELVAALALVAPLAAPMRLPPGPVLPYAIPGAVLRALAAATVATPLALSPLGGRRVRRLFAPEPVPPDFVTRFGGLLAARPAAAAGASADLMVGARGGMAALARRLGEIDRPVGILFGRGDRVLDPRRHGEAARDAIPGATLELVEGGHMLPVTAPATVAAFVAGVARRAAG